MKRQTTARALYTAGGAGVIGGALVIVALASLLVLPVRETLAAGPNESHVVVILPGELDVSVRPISFTGQISGPVALEMAGFDMVAVGDTVCAIEGVGCPDATDIGSCFCPDNFWAQAPWDAATETWDTTTFPLPLMSDGDVRGFRGAISFATWGPPRYPAPAYVAASDALEWLRGKQSPTDGGYGTAYETVNTLLAVGANHLDAASWRRGTSSPSLLTYELGTGAEYANGTTGRSAMLAVGLAATGGCWPFGTRKPMDFYDPATGEFDAWNLNHAWAMLGTSALSQTVPASASQHLKGQVNADGGWAWSTPPDDSDTNATALAVQALVAAGEPLSSGVITNALNYLKSAQNTDGGFPYTTSSPDTNSTAWAVQAILAGGEDPLTGRWVVSSSDPLSYLLSIQLPDGSFEYQVGGGSNLLATQQAVGALLRQPFPLKAVDLPLCYGIAGQVVSGTLPVGAGASAATGDPVAGVVMWAEAAGDLYADTTTSSGSYTISVPGAGSYTLTPYRSGYVFSPTSRSVTVSGNPGHISHVGVFVGDVRHNTYLPVTLRDS